MVVISATLVLSACSVEHASQIQHEADLARQCQAAQTYGESYGTPDARGPCWVRTTAHASMAGIQSFTVRSRRSGANGIAVLTYQNGRLVQVIESAGI